jgi:hypothetical protein
MEIENGTFIQSESQEPRFYKPHSGDRFIIMGDSLKSFPYDNFTIISRTYKSKCKRFHIWKMSKSLIPHEVCEKHKLIIYDYIYKNKPFRNSELYKMVVEYNET